HLIGSHATRHFHTGKHARGETRRADRAGRTVKHGAVRRWTAAKVMALHQAGKAAALARADHIHNVLRLELARQNAIALFQVARALPEMKFTQELDAFGARFRQVFLHRLVRLFGILDQAELHAIVAVGRGGLALRHHARARLDERHRDYLPLRSEHLRHTDLFAENSWTHRCLSLYCMALLLAKRLDLYI